MYIGPSLARVTKGDTFTFKFTMTVADVPTTLTTPTVKAYEEGSNVEFTGGITLNVDYDGKTGLNELIIDTSDAAYSAGKNYDFFFSAGSIGAVTLVGTGFFHLALIPEPADLRMVNGGSTGAMAGKLELAQLKITATGSDNALDISADDNNAYSINVSGSASFYSAGYEAVTILTDGADKSALRVSANGSGDSIAAQFNNFTYGTGVLLADSVAGDPYNVGGGLTIFGPNSGGPAIDLVSKDGNPVINMRSRSGTTTGPAVTGTSLINIVSQASNNINGIEITPTGTGKAITALGQVLIAPTNTDDSALVLTPEGAGKSIDAVVEGSVGIVESLMLANAANAGKTNGMGTTTAHLRNLEDDKNRITAQVDSNGNRTSITLDVT